MQATAVRIPSRPRVIPWARMGDESLAGHAAAGNKDAFAALYERYHGPLLGYCRSILLNAEDAGDAAQNALENALRALPRREPGRPLRPWLYKIAHNESINIIRRRQPIADSNLLDSDSSLLTVPGPEADVEQRSRLTQLVDDLRVLPERQRGALVMRELSGLSYNEIGLALGVSNEAARRAVFDARNALHDAVDGRATECTSVRRTLSDGDRRHLRARGMRAHLRSCDDCATFEKSMGIRQADLHALGAWLAGSAALGLLGIGGGAGGSAIVAAGGSGSAVAAGGGLWAGLPAAAKGLAVAAVVATTGTAAVEIPKVATPESRAPQGQVATAKASLAQAAASAQTSELQRRAAAQAAAAVRARRERAARHAAAAVRSHGGGAASTTVDRGAAQARPTTPAPAATAPVTHAPATPAQRSGATQSAPAAARTPEQIAADNLQRIRDKITAAFASAQTVADSGAQGALATANSIVQNTIGQVLPSIQRILGSLGLSLPSSTTTAPPTSPTNTTITNVLAPAQSLLSGVNTMLQNLFRAPQG
ncbi:MAG TPA: sigma-70 family RNA polymerase sigma factor [Solirubrobacteraceae bacterium]|nr:sigma-70 family RNA polymerase sigma factor [Solirubrobacteraceae bacterium]